MENEMELPVTAQGDYPKVQVQQKNSHYARLISLDIASSMSEMTAIYQYLYQNWMLEEPCPQISRLAMRIAEVEMHHLHILGQLVRDLGGLPRCQYNNGGRIGVWNGAMPNYQQSPKMIIKLNIQSEKAACKTYETQASCIKDPCVSAVLQRLAQDEKVHVTIWESLCEEFC